MSSHFLRFRCPILDKIVHKPCILRRKWRTINPGLLDERLNLAHGLLVHGNLGF